MGLLFMWENYENLYTGICICLLSLHQVSWFVDVYKYCYEFWNWQRSVFGLCWTVLGSHERLVFLYDLMTSYWSEYFTVDQFRNSLCTSLKQRKYLIKTCNILTNIIEWNTVEKNCNFGDFKHSTPWMNLLTSNPFRSVLALETQWSLKPIKY